MQLFRLISGNNFLRRNKYDKLDEDMSLNEMQSQMYPRQKKKHFRKFLTRLGNLCVKCWCIRVYDEDDDDDYEQSTYF